MKRSIRQSGLTLVEILAVLGIVAILFAIGVPAAKKIVESFDSAANIRSVISAALSNARSLAMAENTYVGIRFQQDKAGRQYMILIRYDYDATGLANGFRAVDQRKPMKLPDQIGVMDLFIRTNRTANGGASDPTCVPIGIVPSNPANDALSDLNIDEPLELTDTTTFSIVFSKEGRLVSHEVRVRNRQGTSGTNNTGIDDVFNTKPVVDAGTTATPSKVIFYQDDYADLGLGQEWSRNSFVIYDKRKFGSVPNTQRWSRYLKSLPREYVNPHTGEVVGMQ